MFYKFRNIKLFLIFTFIISNAKAQESGWVFGNLIMGKILSRSSVTITRGTTGAVPQSYDEKDKIGSLMAGELIYDHFYPKWIIEGGLGYYKSQISFLNYLSTGTSDRKIGQKLTYSNVYFSFTPRYRGTEGFAIAPRLEFHYGSNVFHSEVKTETGKYLLYIGFDGNYDFYFADNKIIRTGFQGLVDINEAKRTSILLKVYIGLGFNIFSKHSQLRQRLETRPILRTQNVIQPRSQINQTQPYNKPKATPQPTYKVTPLNTKNIKNQKR